MRQEQSLNKNLFNIIKCTAACHGHDANPYGQSNGEEKTEREGDYKYYKSSVRDLIKTNI